MTEQPNEAVELVARVLRAHLPDGIVSSRDNWVGCDCGENLPCPVDDGFPDYDVEEVVTATHRAEHIVSAVRDALAAGGKDADAIAEAIGLTKVTCRGRCEHGSLFHEDQS